MLSISHQEKLALEGSFSCFLPAEWFAVGATSGDAWNELNSHGTPTKKLFGFFNLFLSS